MKRFYSKILLFGEYSILAGSSALTIPFKKYSGEFSFSDLSSDEEIQSNEILIDLCAYIQQNQSSNSITLDLTSFESDLEKGLYFKSSIPTSYGLGSSGSLVAALFDRYTNLDILIKDKIFLIHLRNEMAMVESFFHGTSSGIDPLSVYIGQPLKIDSSSDIITIDENLLNNLGNFYLYDTGIKSGTGYLVDSFLKRINDMLFRPVVDEILIPAVNNGINSLVNNDDIAFQPEIKTISHFQLKYFKEAIPDYVLQIWQTGLETGDFYFKLCGSGGGGFMLIWSILSKSDLEQKLGSHIISVVDKDI